MGCISASASSAGVSTHCRTLTEPSAAAGPGEYRRVYRDGTGPEHKGHTVDSFTQNLPQSVPECSRLKASRSLQFACWALPVVHLEHSCSLLPVKGMLALDGLLHQGLHQSLPDSSCGWRVCVCASMFLLLCPGCCATTRAAASVVRRS